MRSIDSASPPILRGLAVPLYVRACVRQENDEAFKCTHALRSDAMESPSGSSWSMMDREMKAVVKLLHVNRCVPPPFRSALHTYNVG
mmetsp:Transcript_15840/g.30619  ORF Transcript_15840/g.30619 Transcript_15840/m.30619 type:complete len:87 (+) Transcript_15840:88-348(+)